jgi:hypothetical protein
MSTRSVDGVLIRWALFATAIALCLAFVLLLRETAYTFVLFMFVGPPLLAVGALLLGVVIWRELRAKEVL